jgi:hypothetical protein
MAGIRIDWAALEHAFENHAPDVRSYLDRENGEVVVVSGSEGAAEVHANPDRFIFVEPVPSREQYRMMERFIETVPFPALQEQLRDAIVGKGAFRRFKDAVGRHPEERKRWFAFRDVLLHQYVLEWLQLQRLTLAEMPDWTLELPSAEQPEATAPAREVAPDRQELRELKAYLQSWARSHGEEYRYLFGPGSFDRLAEDMFHEFNVTRRR